MKGIAIVRSLLRRPPARSVLRSEAAEIWWWASGGAAFEKKSHDPLTRVDQSEGARVEGRVKV